MTNFTLIDKNRGTQTDCKTRAQAEEKKDDMVALGASPEDLEIVTDASSESEESDGADNTQTKEPASDGGQAAVAEPVDDYEDENLDELPDIDNKTDEYDLPNEGPSVDEDPLVWMPDEFTDTVDGTVTINRKGFEVLAHHYDVSGGTEMVVSPVETDMTYAVHRATVTDNDGEEYTAYGEAHATDNGEENIVRMSDTRAYKRAVSRATGVGTIAIEELQNEL